MWVYSKKDAMPHTYVISGCYALLHMAQSDDSTCTATQSKCTRRMIFRYDGFSIPTSWLSTGN